MKPTTVRISKNISGAVVSTIKLELTTVPNSKKEYRAVISQNTSEIIPKIALKNSNLYICWHDNVAGRNTRIL